MRHVRWVGLLVLLWSGLAHAQAIPGLAFWETWMVGNATQGGEHWCNDLSTTFNDDESEVWYYDGQRIFFQIKDYTTGNDAFWESCAQKSEGNYRPYVITNNGNIDGWRVFPHGLAMDWLRNGDATSRSAVVMLANGLWSSDDAALWSEGSVAAVDHNVYTREISYALNTHTMAETVGETHRAWGDRLAQGCRTHIAQWFTNTVAATQSTDIKFFMVGLNLEALIGWYALHPSGTILTAIQDALDGLWPHWSSANKRFPYCWDRPGGGHLAPGNDDCASDFGTANRAVNNIIGHAFGWYCLQSSNQTYCNRGDEIFDGAADFMQASSGGNTGKEFSQAYRSSFNYVTWRLAATGDTLAPAAPTNLHVVNP